jgi:hypothetical protein
MTPEFNPKPRPFVIDLFTEYPLSFAPFQGIEKQCIKKVRLIIHHEMSAFRYYEIRDVVLVQETRVGIVDRILAKHIPLLRRQLQKPLIEISLTSLFGQGHGTQVIGSWVGF